MPPYITLLKERKIAPIIIPNKPHSKTEINVLNRIVRGSFISLDMLPILLGPCFITAVAAIIRGPLSLEDIFNYLVSEVIVAAIAPIPLVNADIKSLAS